MVNSKDQANSEDGDKDDGFLGQSEEQDEVSDQQGIGDPGVLGEEQDEGELGAVEGQQEEGDPGVLGEEQDEGELGAVEGQQEEGDPGVLGEEQDEGELGAVEGQQEEGDPGVLGEEQDEGELGAVEGQQEEGDPGVLGEEQDEGELGAPEAAPQGILASILQKLWSWIPNWELVDTTDANDGIDTEVEGATTTETESTGEESQKVPVATPKKEGAPSMTESLLNQLPGGLWTEPAAAVPTGDISDSGTEEKGEKCRTLEKPEAKSDGDSLAKGSTSGSSAGTAASGIYAGQAAVPTGDISDSGTEEKGEKCRTLEKPEAKSDGDSLAKGSASGSSAGTAASAARETTGLDHTELLMDASADMLKKFLSSPPKGPCTDQVEVVSTGDVSDASSSDSTETVGSTGPEEMSTRYVRILQLWGLVNALSSCVATGQASPLPGITLWIRQDIKHLVQRTKRYIHSVVASGNYDLKAEEELLGKAHHCSLCLLELLRDAFVEHIAGKTGELDPEEQSYATHIRYTLSLLDTTNYAIEGPMAEGLPLNLSSANDIVSLEELRYRLLSFMQWLQKVRNIQTYIPSDPGSADSPVKDDTTESGRKGGDAEEEKKKRKDLGAKPKVVSGATSSVEDGASSGSGTEGKMDKSWCEKQKEEQERKVREWEERGTRAKVKIGQVVIESEDLESGTDSTPQPSWLGTKFQSLAKGVLSLEKRAIKSFWDTFLGNTFYKSKKPDKQKYTEVLPPKYYDNAVLCKDISGRWCLDSPDFSQLLNRICDPDLKKEAIKELVNLHKSGISDELPFLIRAEDFSKLLEEREYWTLLFVLQNSTVRSRSDLQNMLDAWAYMCNLEVKEGLDAGVRRVFLASTDGGRLSLLLSVELMLIARCNLDPEGPYDLYNCDVSEVVAAVDKAKLTVPKDYQCYNCRFENEKYYTSRYGAGFAKHIKKDYAMVRTIFRVIFSLFFLLFYALLILPILCITEFVKKAFPCCLPHARPLSRWELQPLHKLKPVQEHLVYALARLQEEQEAREETVIEEEADIEEAGLSDMAVGGGEGGSEPSSSLSSTTVESQKEEKGLQ